MTNWYYAVEQQQHGPVPEEQLRELLTQGAVAPDCLVWSDGMAQWQKASEIEALFPARPPPVPEPPPPPPQHHPRTAILSGGGMEDFNIGPVFRDTLTALKTRLGTFLLISLLPHLLSAVVSGLFTMSIYASRSDRGTVSTLGVIFFLVGIPFIFWVHLFAQGAIAYSAFHNLCGRSVRFGEAMRQGMRRVLPLLGMVVLVLAALFVTAVIEKIADKLHFSTPADLILVVLGTILCVILFVSLPACMVEKTGLIGSMKRSARLTKGCRWKIFGISLLTALALGLGFGLAYVVILGIAAGAGWLGSMTGLVLAVLFALVFATLVVLVTTALMAVVLAATYANLRRAEDGITPDEIASVFD